MSTYDIVSREGQDLFDIAIQEYGSIDHTFYLLEDNASLNLADKLDAGTTIKIRTDPEVDDKARLEYFRRVRVSVNNNDQT